MTVSHPSEDTSCVHTEDWFDDWDDVYEVEPPLLRLIRTCEDCGAQEEYTLTADPNSDFQHEFQTWTRKQEQAEIADVSLQVVPEKSDGVDAYAHLVIERGERSGHEVVSSQPYYFFY